MTSQYTASAPAAHITGTPFVANGLFGWLHATRHPAEHDLAVLICPALAYDALDSYHSLRVLADRLAEAGYPVMRFNYPGTGDSCDIVDWHGTPGAVGRREPWAVWLQSIHFAAGQLREMTGAKNLVLCGVRIGATLATLAAESLADARLVLLAPVLRGRSYLRQMQVEAAFQYKDAVADRAALDFHELNFDAATVNHICQVDLRQARLHQAHKIVVFADPAPLLAASVAAWRARGAAVECHGFAGFEPMLCHDTQGDAVPADPTPVIDWLNRQSPAGRPAAAAAAPSPSGLQLAGCQETPLRFGPQQRLFGMFCHPSGQSCETAVVIVNTGRHPRHGVGRFGVDFSRQLACAGIASLRIDFAGLGDSQGPDGCVNLRSDVFEDERAGDIKAAIDALAARGYSKFAVQGLCSGAYHAFHGGLADPRIGAMLLVNLPLFIWQRGDTIAAAKQRSYTLSHYALRLADSSMWVKLLRGQSDLRGILSGQIKRIRHRLRPLWRRGDAGSGNADSSDANSSDVESGYAGSKSFAKRSMAKLASRRVRTLFLFAPDNVGVYEMELHFGKGGARLRAFPGVTVEIVAGLDQILTCHETRQLAAATMIKFLAAGQ